MTARKATEAAVTKPDFATLLAGAKLPEATVPVCMRADLVADHEAADRELERLLESPSRKFNDGTGELRKAILDLEAEMQAATYTFRFRALPKPVWRALIAQHQPRRGDDGEVNEQDAAIGINVETFYDALIRACLLDPVLDEAAWSQLNETLTDRQYDTLATAAWNLNRRDVDVPFSRAASRQTETSEQG